MTKQRICKDCATEGIATKRPAPHPGPRCATHHRAVQKQVRTRAHDRRVQQFYGITPEQYWKIYQAQGGVCAICCIASGKARRLAVDHDHKTGEVRGLLCGPCNQMIGRLGPMALIRALEYRTHPPARVILKS